MDDRICQHAVGLVVTLKRNGNELLASFKDVERVAEHKYGANTFSAPRRASDLKSNRDSGLQYFGLNNIREFEKIGDGKLFSTRFYFGPDNKYHFFLINIMTECVDDNRLFQI